MLSIEELLAISKANTDLSSRLSTESNALSFWQTNKHLKHPNNKAITKIEVAKNFDISAKRLGDLIKDPSRVGMTKGHPTRLSFKEEKVIVKWIIHRCKAHMYTSRQMVIRKAESISVLKSKYGYGHKTKCGPIGKDWYYNFLNRHSSDLGMRKLQALDISRVEARKTMPVLLYFIWLRDVLVEHRFRDDRIFNIDETPCQIDNIQKYGLWAKSIKESHVVNTCNRQVLTMMPCVSAAGECIPPLIIFEGKTVDSGYISYEFDMVVSTNDNSYMTKDIFREWSRHFVKCAKPTVELPVLLILDNFKGHLDWDAFEYLHNNNVYLAGLPPHTSDKTQPLDLSVFGPFKIAYRNVFDGYLQEYSIKNIHQRDFVLFLKDAYKKSFTHDNISSGFSRAGIVPSNPFRILKQCVDWNQELFAPFVPRLDKNELPISDLVQRSELSQTTNTGMHLFI